jgi:hypothetical protein
MNIHSLEKIHFENANTHNYIEFIQALSDNQIPRPFD